MMALLNKRKIKELLGELPLTAEVYWRLRQPGRPLTKNFSLQRLSHHIPTWVRQATEAGRNHPPGKQVLIFTTLRYWIEHATLMGAALSGLGHKVTLAYLPYANWMKAVNRFDLRRQNVYSRQVLARAAPMLQAISYYQYPAVHDGNSALPTELDTALKDISLRDAQYTLQLESVDLDSDLYQLRLERNRHAARAFMHWIQSQAPAQRPQVVITPNGSILEMGAIYHAARYLRIPVVTYEFGEQRDRIWLAKDAEVMRQETETLWASRQHTPLSKSQLEQIRALMASRQRADLWENFSRRWQGLPSQGAGRTRAALGLQDPSEDPRPVVLLAANVIGDSLTLGRQIFTPDMTTWLQRTLDFFIHHPETQFIIRIHPGERYTKGPSVADVLRSKFSELPPHIHLVGADAAINTYDLIEIADLGLVYTTTVGLEMALSGLPVIVAGHTHYRRRGFTLDPKTWNDYKEILEDVLASPENHQLRREQVSQAWNYAYRFFFEYPTPYPWHLLNFWDDLTQWPLESVLSREGQERFGRSFRYLVGEERDWESGQILPTATGDTRTSVSDNT